MYECEGKCKEKCERKWKMDKEAYKYYTYINRYVLRKGQRERERGREKEKENVVNRNDDLRKSTIARLHM